VVSRMAALANSSWTLNPANEAALNTFAVTISTFSASLGFAQAVKFVITTSVGCRLADAAFDTLGALL